MNLSRQTLLFALALITLGVVGYFAVGRVSVTALIPAFLGAPVLWCAVSLHKNPAQRWPVYTALALAVIAIAGGVPGAVTLAQSFADGVDIGAAAISRTLMFVVSAVYLSLAAVRLRQRRES